MLDLNFSGKSLEENIKKLIKDKKDAHFFLDETPVSGSNGLSVKFLCETSSNLPDDTIFWLACNHVSKAKLNPKHLEKGGKF